VVLDDRGAPIAGASVFAPTGTADETDDRGLFYVTSTAPYGAYFGLSVYKTGYEPQNLFVRGPTEVVTLHDIVRLPVGESIRITMGANESVDPDVEYRYRRVRIVSSTPTAVELSVTAADGGTPDWELEKGPCCPSPPTVVTSIDDVGVELVAWFRDSFWNPVHRTYTLSTRRVGQ
jgi:hypothetical protein